MATMEDFSTEETLVYLAAMLGGLNWILVDMASFNIATEIGVVGAGAVYTVVGLAGAAGIADLFDVIDLSQMEVFGE